MRNTLGRTSNSYQSKEPLTNDALRRYAPSIFAEAKHSSRSERYSYIPTIQVVDGMRNEGFLPFFVAQSRTRQEGKQDFTKHLIRFRHADQIGLLKVGTEIPEVILINSHDGTSSYEMRGGIFRLVCTNGLVVGDTFQSVKVHHKGNVKDMVIDAAYEVVQSFPAIQSKMVEMKETKLLPAAQEAFAEAAISLRYDTEEKAAPVTPTQVLTPRRREDAGADVWTIFNRTQEHLVNGGLNGTASQGRRSRTRAVQGLNESVRLNKALWTLSERMTEILRNQ
jgi:hypothetical protein